MRKQEGDLELLRVEDLRNDIQGENEVKLYLQLFCIKTEFPCSYKNIHPPHQLNIRMQEQERLNVLNMEDMHLNLTFNTTPLPGSINNISSLNDVIDYESLDSTIDEAYGNYSGLCPSMYQNFTYLNVSCDTAINFSVPLLGKCICYLC